ncbi:SCO0930 family lipoprotein [Streptomyces indicus]|uniref:Predicted lipoprotein with conserved Yx(FWY)xxD motif n=1 Tax=Streptomyces indicus TaxID=417292 RepID=A0A1G8TXY0_9ACTN|nr:SCO0930 family lipoprotein [Streptomyces indicus]SDJ46307.1 Predicted lipoprotein with conserved Yx(FWY)xxD motif [Streptomyces indicus]
MKTWRSASIAAAAALLALTTACGQEKGSDQPNGQSVGNAAPADGGYGDGYGGGGDADAAAAEPKSAGQLAVWDSKELGKVVTDSAGFTLYRFDKDTAKPPKSTCDGDCETAWPVVAAEGAKAAPGVDPSLIGSVQRTDGTEQLTIAGWPMYRYAQDKKPGDAKGQGVGGTWFAAAPDGKKASPAAAEEEGGEQADLAGLSTRKDPKLGEIVIDKNGMTVYRFKKDSAWPMKSACTGDCLANWPVVEPVDKNDTEGILKKGFVTFNRPDGLKQQTIDCWPLYTYAGDSAPGDTNGQGVGGTWYAVSPEGKLVGAPK